MKRGATVLALAVLLAGCGEPPGVYRLSAHEAYERLAGSELPELRFARQCGILIHFVPEGEPDRSVTWRVYSSGVEMLSFTATLTPLGPQKTKIDIAVSSDLDGKEAYSGGRFYPRPALRQPVRPAIEEQVAALMEARPFDISRVPRQGPSDKLCNIQRAGLEHGHRFGVHDKPGLDSRETEAERVRAGW